MIAAVSSEEKLAFARKHGADDGVVYPPGPFDKAGAKALADLFKQACGENGADVIYDPVGGDYSEAALRAIAWEGRFLVVGFPAGIAKLPLNLTLLKSCQVVGVFWGAFARRDPKANAANIAELMQLYAKGAIKPRGLRALSAGPGRRGHRQARRAQGHGQDRRDDGVSAMSEQQTRWWWIRHAPVPDGGRIYGQSDLDCDCSDAEIFGILARELPRDAVWVTSNLAAHATDGRGHPGRGSRRPLCRHRAARGAATSPSSIWANGRGRSARRSMPRARSAPIRCGLRPPTSARRRGELRRSRRPRARPPSSALNAEHRGRDIVAVTHGGTIRAALALALDVPPQAALSFSIENCSLTRLDYLRPPGIVGLWRVGAVNHRPWSRAAAAERLEQNPVAHRQGLSADRASLRGSAFGGAVASLQCSSPAEGSGGGAHAVAHGTDRRNEVPLIEDCTSRSPPS